MILLCALVAGSVGAWAIDDVINNSATSSNLGSTSSTTWATDFSINSTSGATYKIHSMGTKNTSNALQWNQNGYLYATKTGGKLKNVTISGSDGKQLNIYASNTAYSSKASGTALSQITLTEGTGTYEFTSDYEYIAINGTQSNTSLISITITYEEATSANTVITPVISGTEKFLESTEVSISCGTDGAAIQYSIDGGTTWTDYTAAFTLNATTTVQAKATKSGMDDSSTASKTFTKITPMTVTEALTAINALEDNGTIADSYVLGKISRVVSIYSGALTYWISDNGEEENELQVYRGKGIDGDSFSATTDLEFGDEVVIFGELKKYVSNSATTPEFNTGSELISITAKPSSDLTKISDITLDYKNGATDDDLTDYFTSSSAGAITYTVADETVIEQADELISALKVGTTTVTISQAATLAYKAGEITINVTVQDTREAATTIPAINISTLKMGDEGSISVTAPVKADEGVTFSYASSNDDVLLIVDDAYEAEAVGTVTVTVTATPSNTNLYAPVTETFEVTVEADVKTDTEIILDATSGSTGYGTSKSVDYTITDGYDGTLAYAIDNSDVADVEIGASAITFTPKAVGTAVITISAPATATFNAADNVTYTLNVTAPEGGTTAPNISPVTLDFSNNTTWEFPTTKTVSTNTYSDGTNSIKLTGSSNNGYNFFEQYKCLLIGKNGATIEFPAFANDVKKIEVTGHSNASSSVSMNIYEGSTAVSTQVTGITGTQTFAIDDNHQAAGTVFTLKVTNANNAQIKSITITFKSTALTATLNASGYATYCSQYPLNFSGATDYSAWQITDIDSDNKITFTKITGTVKGGTGVFLKGEAGATVTLTSADSNTELSDNLLEGTLAPTYVESGKYYGLSGASFVKINGGTVKAGKAILDADWITENADSRFTFVFADESTGISEIEYGTLNADNTVYNLNGQHVDTPKNGMYIVNGKKVIIK